MVKNCHAAFLLVFLSILTQAQEFQPGRYYDQKGKRIEGYISSPPVYYKAPPTILFKKNLNDPEPEVVKIGKMKGFVMGADTFAILTQFRAEGATTMYISVVAAAARVLEVGKVILYEYTFTESIGASLALREAILGAFIDSATRMEYTTTNYLLQQAGKGDIFAARMSQQEFNRQMSDYLKMNQPLADSIRAGAYSNKHTPEIIHKFNAWYQQRKAAAAP